MSMCHKIEYRVNHMSGICNFSDALLIRHLKYSMTSTKATERESNSKTHVKAKV
jgi:hypothetical protein